MRCEAALSLIHRWHARQQKLHQLKQFETNFCSKERRLLPNALMSASPHRFLPSLPSLLTSAKVFLEQMKCRSCPDSRKLGPSRNHHWTHDAQTSLPGLDAKLHETGQTKLGDAQSLHDITQQPPLCPGQRFSASRTFSYNPSSPRCAFSRRCFSAN